MTVDYRVVVEVGAHAWDVTGGDPPAYGPTLPLSFGWEIPESVEFFPAQRNPLTGSFGIVAASMADVADIAPGDPVRVEVYAPATGTAEPWQRVVGVVSQVDARVGVAKVGASAGTGVVAADACLLTVYVTDPLLLLADKVIGVGETWPAETVTDRLSRICDLADLGLTLLDPLDVAHGTGLLPAREGWTDVLSAIRATLKDDATAIDDPWATAADAYIYGRPVYSFDPYSNTVNLGNFNRFVEQWPIELGDDGKMQATGEPNGLDGCATQIDGVWTRQRSDRYGYVVVDEVTVAYPEPYPPELLDDLIPLMRSTAYEDDPGTTDARERLAGALLPDPEWSTTWRTGTLRHLSYLDPFPVTGWVADDDPTDPGNLLLSWAKLRPTIIAPIDPDLSVDGKSWRAGLLTACRLTIPPGGEFYIDFTLRPEAPETTIGEALTYGHVDPGITFGEVDPVITFRDARLLRD